MLFDPTERNVDPFLFPARVRTMQELVLALAIHDKNVTMAKTAQVSSIIRTGPTPPSKKCGATKTHRICPRLCSGAVLCHLVAVFLPILVRTFCLAIPPRCLQRCHFESRPIAFNFVGENA